MKEGRVGVGEEVRMVFILTLIALLSGAILGATYEVTRPYIQKQQELQLRQAVLSVLPAAQSFERLERGGRTLYRGLDGEGRPVGLAIEVEGKGFGGPIRLLVGVDPETRRLTGLQVLAHQETPGLGARIQEEEWRAQFKGKAAGDPFVVKQDVQAITGATISSRAVAVAVKEAVSEVLAQEEGRP
ncbi:MAG: RnfABCDGE type electron transport complex subunit G [Bacillota bacterium]|nr:RnfABCDGE type electron transport complex subunit G [Bacillota bacterium]